MYRDNDVYGIYGSLPMQAALQLYLPYVEETSEPPRHTSPLDRPRRPRRSRRTGRHKPFRDLG